jgi:hypothetical protein
MKGLGGIDANGQHARVAARGKHTQPKRLYPNRSGPYGRERFLNGGCLLIVYIPDETERDVMVVRRCPARTRRQTGGVTERPKGIEGLCWQV